MKSIEKEKICELKFPMVDVLDDNSERVHRFTNAQKARILGNTEKSKVRISFCTTDGPCEVNTTVWDVDQDFVMLKGASALPLRCIYSISL